jgi:hypothetical protein
MRIWSKEVDIVACTSSKAKGIKIKPLWPSNPRRRKEMIPIYKWRIWRRGANSR